MNEQATTQTIPEPKPRNKVLQFISHHPLIGLLGILGSVASIVSAPYTIWPWLAGGKRDLSYAFSPTRTRIVQANGNSQLAVTYRGKPVSGDITAVQIAVWNNGREPIRQDDVLDSVLLKMPTNVSILDLSMVTLTRPVTGFEMFSTNLSAGHLQFKWKILERNDGAVVQVIYSGPPDAPFALTGTVVEQGQPHLHKSTLPTTLLRAIAVLIVACTLVIVAGNAGDKLVVKRYLRRGKSWMIWVSAILMLIIAFLVALLAAIATNLYIKTSLTPFGF